jgi:adhesin HecA-like repeat protein
MFVMSAGPCRYYLRNIVVTIDPNSRLQAYQAEEQITMASRPSLKNRLYTALLLAALSPLAAMTASAAEPTLAISASANPAVQGSSITLNVLISDISDLFGYQFSFNFNPAVLQATAVTEGSFLAGGGTTFSDPGTIDNTAGSISFVANSLIGALPGVSGSGSLALISFNVTSVGSSLLSFSDALFLDANLADITVTLQPLTLQAVAVPEPASYLLFSAGLAGLVALRRRRQAV